MSTSNQATSAWVQRFAGLIPSGGRVLDLASGGGRHARYLLELGFRVVAADVDNSGLSDIAEHRALEILETDLEAGPWPFAERSFDGIVVTNYLHRPLLPLLPIALSPGGVLIYETFAAGNGAYGRPRNPRFLLEPDELRESFEHALEIVAYEHGFEETPRPALRQKICARRPRSPRQSTSAQSRSILRNVR